MKYKEKCALMRQGTRIIIAFLDRIGKGKRGSEGKNGASVAGPDWSSGSIDERTSERRGGAAVVDWRKASEIALMGSVPDCD